jgi:tetratricopeptide (TPR) repeat protein
MKIFLSAVSGQFRECREALAKDLHAVEFDVTVQEEFRQHGGTLLEKLQDLVAGCDRVIAVVGSAYGFEPEPTARPDGRPRRSYSQWEYYFALGERLDGSKAQPKDIHVYLANKDYLKEHPVQESEDQAELQRQFLAEIRASGKDRNAFGSLHELCRLVLKDGFPVHERGPKPNNLPLDSIGTLFKGREAFLDDLRSRLGVPGGRAAAIVNRLAVHGLGGVGKTRAAVEYAWRHTDDYTALLFVSAPSVAELRANLAGMAGVLGTTAEKASVEQQMAEVLDWLDTHPGWLLIVDNVDTEEAAAEVQRLLARLRSGHVLITSRIGNWGAGVEPLELDVLAPADAQALLLARTPHRRAAADDAARAAEIAGELDGLALALDQAGAYIDKLRLSFAEYLDRWQARRSEVLRWHDLRLMQYPASVAVTWETTFAQLSEPERRLLEVLSWLAPEPIPLFLFDAAPLVEAIPDLREALAGLAGYSLARFDAAGEAVVVHRLVLEITRGRIPVADRNAALQIALRAVNDVAQGDSRDVRTWPIWAPLAAHVEAVSRYADAAGQTEPTARLMNDLGVYWLARGQFRTAEPLIRRALGIGERSHGPDHPHVATYLSNLANLLRATGRMSEAEPLIRRALAIDERSYGPDHPDVARDLNDLAELLKYTNRLSEAEPLLRRALAIDERSLGPDHPDVARDLNDLAELLGDTNRLSEAEPLQRRALAIDERLYGPNHPAVANRLNNLAGLHIYANRMSEAEPLLRRALAISERCYGPDHPHVAIGLNNLAMLLEDTSRASEAEPLYRRALAIDERLYGPNHPAVANRLNNLALLLKATNRSSEAEPLYRRCLQILIEFRHRNGHQHPNLHTALDNYRDFLQALGKTPEQIEQQLRELDESLSSEGS